MDKYYIIFEINKTLDNWIILNITSDYYYFRRLVKKYLIENKIIYTKEITLNAIIENSRFTR